MDPRDTDERERKGRKTEGGSGREIERNTRTSEYNPVGLLTDEITDNGWMHQMEDKKTRLFVLNRSVCKKKQGGPSQTITQASSNSKQGGGDG